MNRRAGNRKRTIFKCALFKVYGMRANQTASNHKSKALIMAHITELSTT